MAESFEFVKGLINNERYKDYKKDEWGGCDLVIVSNEKYEARKEFYDKRGTKGCHKLIHHDFAKSIIWLMEYVKIIQARNDDLRKLDSAFVQNQFRTYKPQLISDMWKYAQSGGFVVM